MTVNTNTHFSKRCQNELPIILNPKYDIVRGIKPPNTLLKPHESLKTLEYRKLIKNQYIPIPIKNGSTRLFFSKKNAQNKPIKAKENVCSKQIEAVFEI